MTNKPLIKIRNKKLLKIVVDRFLNEPLLSETTWSPTPESTRLDKPKKSQEPKSVKSDDREISWALQSAITALKKLLKLIEK